MQYTDTQLKQILSKMLPDKLIFHDNRLCYKLKGTCYKVLDTELLHLCWLVEGTLTEEEQFIYAEYLLQELRISNLMCDWSNELVYLCTHATWQQRVIALAKVKGIEIV